MHMPGSGFADELLFGGGERERGGCLDSAGGCGASCFIYVLRDLAPEATGQSDTAGRGQWCFGAEQQLERSIREAESRVVLSAQIAVGQRLRMLEVWPERLM